MFSFQWPWFALLLPLPVLAWRYWPASRTDEETEKIRLRTALVHPALDYLEKAYASATPGVPASTFLSYFLLGLLWVVLTLSLMQPQWLREHREIKSRGYDLMLAVDLSRSMLALDFTVKGERVNRLQVVKGVVGRFIEQREGDRIGLILFGNGAYVQAPLTLDGKAVRSMLDNSKPRIAGDATAIGDAIGLAVKKLRERPPGSRVLILLTDGENTAGILPPEPAALMAAQYGIRIYAVGVGSTGEVPFPDDKTGEILMEEMIIDEDLLQRVAWITGGAYFRATDTSALEGIYEKINSMEKTEAETSRVWIPESLYRWPLGAALLILLLLAIFSMRQQQKL
ncbi:MAG: VWA domain-containing protein [Gammaproteobacteria bacterium]|nr:VWA domain-containing protein [Gammaproteobacteria bacterium]